MNALTWIFFVTSAVMIVTFCYIFTRGYENRGLGEGARFGLFLGFLVATTQAFDSYAAYPLPDQLVLKWFLSGLAVFVVMGMAMALVYRSEQQ